MNRFPARLHILLAREARLGLVIRRGPSKKVCTVLWDRRTDQFKIGQWLHGRIYERRCDLAPDGKYFIYFAMNGRWHSRVRGSWSAISRTPYLKAMALFPKGDCWNGGGLFTGERTYWLNDGLGHSEMLETQDVRRDREFRLPQYFGGECLSVYYPRLMRDGWTATRLRNNDASAVDVFDKPLPKGWILRKLAHAEASAPPGNGCYWDEHELIHSESAQRFSYPTWEWADLDRKRLTWASKGKLFTGRLTGKGLVDEHELFDFNEMTFEAIKAPY